MFTPGCLGGGCSARRSAVFIQYLVFFLAAFYTIMLHDTAYHRVLKIREDCSHRHRSQLNDGTHSTACSMTSGVARTALGAGASLALRPSMGQYLSSVSEQGSGDYSPREGQSRPGNNTESMTLKVDKDDMEIKDDREPGSRGWGRKRFASYPSPSTQQRRQQQQIQPNHRRQGSPVLDFTLIPALLRSSSGGKSGGRGVSPAPAPVAPPVRYPDPLRPSRLSASAVLPEDEAVEKVREERILRRDDSYLGWGTGSGGDGGGPPAPPPPGAGAPGRRRWGSGHYYKVCVLYTGSKLILSSQLCRRI